MSSAAAARSKAANVVASTTTMKFLRIELVWAKGIPWALATAVRKKLWTEAERENGLACWLLGASFITEGAIPFAAAHPLRVIPATMAGSAVTGGLVMAFGNQLRAPHGGLFVLPLVSNPILYLVAIVIGTTITAAVVILLMSLDKEKTEEIAHEEDIAEGVAA